MIVLKMEAQRNTKQDIVDGVRASNIELKNDYLTNMSGTDNNFNGIPVYGNNSLDSNVKNIKKILSRMNFQMD